MKHPDRVKADEMTRKARWHSKVADQYAEESHEHRDELSGAYSGVSEAHAYLATVLNDKAKLYGESAAAFNG